MRFPDDVPLLSDGTVTLRPHTADDVPWVLEQCSDPVFAEFTTVPQPYTREHAEEWVAKLIPEGWAKESAHEFAVEAEHPDGVRRFAGGVALRDLGDGSASIGYGLHPAVRGGGVCSRAVKLLLDWGFQERGFEVVVWYANVGNWASRRVVWANGFSFQGTLPKFLRHREKRVDAWVGMLAAADDRAPKYEWLTPPVLETDRLRLRPLADADAERFGELLTDEQSRHFGDRVRALRAPSDGAAALLRAWESNAAGERIDWCIADRDTDRLLGHVQLFNLGGLNESSVGTGYGVHPGARGKGVLAEAMRAVVEWTFRPVSAGGLGKRRITASTAVSNVASRRSIERAGFTHVCTEPQAFTIGDTDVDDAAVYHVLNPTWQMP